MNMNDFLHTTVLLHETVDGCLNDPQGIYVDGTFGRGGHSRLLLSKLGEQGRLIGIDKDPLAIASGKELEQEDARFQIVQSSFADMKEALAAQGINQVNGILLDLGVSSPQLDDADGAKKIIETQQRKPKGGSEKKPGEEQIENNGGGSNKRIDSSGI